MDEAPNLCSEAQKRKERLQELKRKAEEAVTLNKDGKKLKLRSYIPSDEKIQDNVIPPAKPSNVEAEVEDQLNVSAPVIKELHINVLAPTKSDSDLKRNIEKKLEKLEKMTNKAIAQIIRERLRTKHNE